MLVDPSQAPDSPRASISKAKGAITSMQRLELRHRPWSMISEKQHLVASQTKPPLQGLLKSKQHETCHFRVPILTQQHGNTDTRTLCQLFTIIVKYHSLPFMPEQRLRRKMCFFSAAPLLYSFLHPRAIMQHNKENNHPPTLAGPTWDRSLFAFG